MAEIQSVLIVANSARMLAQQAFNLGFCVWVIDCYADSDTQKIAKKCIKVNSLALEKVIDATEFLFADKKVVHVIYGSGLERFQETLTFLNLKFTLIGNKPEVFSSVQDKVKFFSKLTDLNITFPETTFQEPEGTNGWLVKPLLGQGGVGIEKYIAKSDKYRACYWQKYLKGLSMSVLFIADGLDYQPVGFNKQLSASEGQFIFSGMVSQPEIGNYIRKVIMHWLAKLVKMFSLNGMNSLDFIVYEGECYVLEINPRPSASMQLYADNYLRAHIMGLGCLSGKLEKSSGQIVCRAYKIIFAKVVCLIKEGIYWPEWASDIPSAGSKIHIGMPICSIIASGIDEQQVEKNLQIREQIISKLLR